MIGCGCNDQTHLKLSIEMGQGLKDQNRLKLKER